MASRIKSYSGYKTLSEADVAKVAKSSPSGLYEDPEFPCAAASIGLPIAGSVASWLRPKEIHSGAEFFVDGVEEGDVVQGALGDCWFLSALAVCAHREELIHNLVVAARPDLGFYQIRFWKELKWIVITIDDRLPCSAARLPLFATSDSGREFWPAVFEKAYAKLHGSYAALESGTVDYGMVDMTGGVADIPDWDELVKGGKLWTRIQEVLDEAWLAGCAINAGKGPKEGDTGVGLLTGHAYSIIGLAKAGGEDLIRLRNPWGQKEWTGRWGDGSTEMTPAVQKQLNYSAADDGTFFMSRADFMHWFDRMYVCRLYQDDIGELWRRNAIYGEWDRISAGGCVNHSTWSQNPQFGLVADGDTKAHISLIQADARMSRGSEPYLPVGFALLRSPSATQRAKMASQSNVVVSTAFQPGRYITREVVLRKGQPYILVGSTFDPGHCRKFAFLLNSEKRVLVYRLNQDGSFEEDDEDPIDLSVSSSIDRTIHGARGSKGKESKGKRSLARSPAAASSSAAASSAQPVCPSCGKLAHGHGKFCGSCGVRFVTTPARGASGGAASTKAVGGRDGAGISRTSPAPHSAAGSTSTSTTVSERSSTTRAVSTARPSSVDPSSLQEQTFSNGDSYVGQSKDGQRHGWGQYSYANGSMYTGYYCDGKKHGTGVFSQGGITYAGDYVNGIKQGKGKLSSSAAIYEGDFHHDKFHGHGTHLDIPSNQRYSGHYREGHKHGKGTLKWNSGATFVGEFCDGTMNEGTYYYPSGDAYTGPFKDGRPHGKGSYRFADGETKEGIWAHGKLTT